MQVQFVEFDTTHQLNDVLQLFHAKKVTANVHVQTAIVKLGFVQNVAVVALALPVVLLVQIEQLAQSFNCVEVATFVPCGDCCNAFRNHDDVLAVFARLLVENDCCQRNVVGEIYVQIATLLYKLRKTLRLRFERLLTVDCGISVNDKTAGNLFVLLRFWNDTHVVPLKFVVGSLNFVCEKLF